MAAQIILDPQVTADADPAARRKPR